MLPKKNTASQGPKTRNVSTLSTPNCGLAPSSARRSTGSPSAARPGRTRPAGSAADDRADRRRVTPAPHRRLLDAEHRRAPCRPRAGACRASRSRTGRVTLSSFTNSSSVSARIATGTLIQKIARQVQNSVRYEPAIGPTAVKSPAMMKKLASPLPRSSVGNAFRTSTVADGIISAPPTPCTTRKRISQLLGDASASGTSPHISEPAANSMMPIVDDSAVAEDVAEAAAERDERGRREGVGRHEPLHARCRYRLEVLLDRRRRNADDREVDHHHRHRRNEWPEDAVAEVLLVQDASPSGWTRRA